MRPNEPSNPGFLYHTSILSFHLIILSVAQSTVKILGLEQTMDPREDPESAFSQLQKFKADKNFLISRTLLAKVNLPGHHPYVAPGSNAGNLEGLAFCSITSPVNDSRAYQGPAPA